MRVSTTHHLQARVVVIQCITHTRHYAYMTCRMQLYLAGPSAVLVVTGESRRKAMLSEAHTF